MKCPECQHKIKATDYDPEFEWYECPGCEGAFTADEILKAEDNGKREWTDAERAKRDRPKGKKKPVAKSKKRQSEIEADEEALVEFETNMLKPQKKQLDAPRHRDETPTKAVVQIMADEIQEVYQIMGGEIDRLNAEDKALILWRDVRYGLHHVVAREREVSHVLCAEHK